jgi:hypothetical protein
MKRIVLIATATVLLSLSILAIIVISSGTTIRAKNSAEAADLSGVQLAALKQKAANGDANAAARIYWYYRLTKRDFVELKKWEYAVTPAPDPTNATNASP